jgi:hypothetical protein
MRSISLTVAMLMVFTGCATGGKAGGTNHGAGGDSGVDPSPRPVAIDPAKVIDLSYAFGDQTIYWPTAAA